MSEQGQGAPTVSLAEALATVKASTASIADVKKICVESIRQGQPESVVEVRDRSSSPPSCPRLPSAEQRQLLAFSSYM
jgi:hypothetical protein